MKDILQLSADLGKVSEKLIPKLMEAQKNTAEQIWSDVLSFAPVASGEYIASIQVSDTEINSGVITTEVFTDLLSEGYLVGRMIEHGTGVYAEEEHVGHTPTFKESGYRFWYTPPDKSKSGEWETHYAQPSHPHFKPALDKNHQTYRENLSKAIKEAFK